MHILHHNSYGLCQQLHDVNVLHMIQGSELFQRFLTCSVFKIGCYSNIT